MQAYLQRNDLQKVISLVKVAFSKLCLKINFKYYFIMYFPLFQRTNYKTLILLCFFLNKALMAQLAIFLKTCFIRKTSYCSGLYICFFLEILETGLDCFEIK
jgi:hypothetical protein